MDSRMSTGPSSRTRSACSKGRLDPTYGQKSALPISDSDDSLDDESLDAIRYLKRVRAEANGLPTVFSGSYFDLQNQQNDETTENNFQNTSVQGQGQYSDGTYFSTFFDPIEATESAIARSHENCAIVATEHEPTYVFPRSAFYTRLINLYIIQSASVVQKSLATEKSANSLDHESIVRPNDHTTNWDYVMRTTWPVLRCLTSMDLKQALRLINLASSMLYDLTSQSSDSTLYLGAWIWALLCRLGEVGTLNSDEISVIRELGKRARSVLLELQQLSRGDTNNFSMYRQRRGGTQTNCHGQNLVDAANERKAQVPSTTSVKMNSSGRRNSSSSAESIVEDSQAELEQAKTRMIAQYATNTSNALGDTISANSQDDYEDEPPYSSLFTMLDIILVIVGQIFGQRDLLDGDIALWEG